METAQLLDRIEKKVRRLKQQNERLSTDNAALEARIFDYLKQLEEAQIAIKRIEDSMKHRAVGDARAHKQALQKDLDHYIKIIDQCMAAMNTRE